MTNGFWGVSYFQTNLDGLGVASEVKPWQTKKTKMTKLLFEAGFHMYQTFLLKLAMVYRWATSTFDRIS